jgi:hypothetical protein
MDREQTQEASWVAQSVTGASAYLHGVDYPQEKFKAELERAVAHIKESAMATA